MGASRGSDLGRDSSIEKLLKEDGEVGPSVGLRNS